MFTVEQIKKAYETVKSGADFPRYIQEIKQMGVTAVETWENDSHTVYFGENNFSTTSQPQYEKLNIADQSDNEKFSRYLKIHQQVDTNYFTFCNHCAEAGIEKWVVSLEALTCTYYDKAGNEILVEPIPQ